MQENGWQDYRITEPSREPFDNSRIKPYADSISREERFMQIKKTLTFILGAALVLTLCTSGYAQIKRICRFKGVDIPFDLKHEDILLEQGKYDLEVMKDMNQQVFHLRIKKKGKTICNVIGEKQNYDSLEIAALMDDPDIPDDPKLRFQRIPAKKIMNIVFESGKRINKYPCVKALFQMEYEEQP